MIGRSMSKLFLKITLLVAAAVVVAGLTGFYTLESTVSLPDAVQMNTGDGTGGGSGSGVIQGAFLSERDINLSVGEGSGSGG